MTGAGDVEGCRWLCDGAFEAPRDRDGSTEWGGRTLHGGRTAHERARARHAAADMRARDTAGRYDAHSADIDVHLLSAYIRSMQIIY